MNSIESYRLSHDAYYTEMKSLVLEAIIDKLLRLLSFTVFSEKYVTFHIVIPLPISCKISCSQHWKIWKHLLLQLQE